MTWVAYQQVEVGYAIPALFVGPQMNMEKLTTPKPQVYVAVSFSIDQERYTIGDLQSLFGSGDFNKFSRLNLLGQLEYNNNASVGVVGGNSAYLNYSTDVIPDTDATSVVVKEPLRVAANQVQLVVFNDSNQFTAVQSYELVIGAAGSSRIETER